MKATLFLTAVLAAPVLGAPAAPQQDNAAARRDGYSSYGDYPPPEGGYANYGDYKGAGETPTTTTTAAPKPTGYASYTDYPPPAGGYSSYGTYRRWMDGLKNMFA